MKKIVVNLISGFSDGGAQKVVYDIVSQLKNDPLLDVRICVICKDEHSNISNLCKKNSIKIDYLEYESSKETSFSSRLKDWIRMNRLVSNYLTNLNPDVLHTHITTIFKYIPFAIALCKSKNRIHTHHSDPDAIDRVSVWIAKIILHIFRITSICVSEDQKTKVDKTYHLRNSIVIHNGIDFSKIQKIDKNQAKGLYNIDRETKVIGCVGRLEPIKNMRFTIDVFDNFHEYEKDSRLFICGSGSIESDLKEYASTKKSKEHILFLGNVKDMYKAYSAMDCFILTSNYESSSIATLEAQAYGIKCYISKAIPSHTIYTETVKRIDVSEGVETWVRYILAGDTFDMVISEKQSYDITACINQVKSLYEQ